MAKKTYTVKSPVEFDHERFEIGSTINLEDKDATPLMGVSAIELSDMQNVAVEVPADPAERQAAIVATIGTLDTNNADIWLRDGRPDVSAIVEITGWPVTAAERNAAWESMQRAA